LTGGPQARKKEELLHLRKKSKDGNLKSWKKRRLGFRQYPCKTKGEERQRKRGDCHTGKEIDRLRGKKSNTEDPRQKRGFDWREEGGYGTSYTA